MKREEVVWGLSQGLWGGSDISFLDMNGTCTGNHFVIHR